MSKLLWDQEGQKIYETGVKNAVLYVQDDSGNYPEGIAWNGITGITESPSGADKTPLYADDTKYLDLVSAEEFGCSIEAYTYPDDFMQCDGTAEIATGVTIGQQDRKAFGLAYKTTVGNDVKSNAYGYKLHLIYGCLASPSEKAYSTVNDSPDAISFSWEVSTSPVEVTGYKKTSTLIIDSTKFTTEAQKAKLQALEDALFGTDADPDDPSSVATVAYLPKPDKVLQILNGVG